MIKKHRLVLLINIVCLLTMLSAPIFCQKYSTAQIDSLWSVWNNKKMHDTTRIGALNKISWNHYMPNIPESAIYYSTIEFEYAQQKGLKKQMATALNVIGGTYYRMADYDQAKSNYLKGLKLYKEINEKEGMSNCLSNLGLIYQIQADYVKAIDAHTKSLKLREEIGHKVNTCVSLENIGLVYLEQGEMERALEYLQRSLKLSIEIGNKTSIANSYNNIGLIYMEQGNYEIALDYFNKCLVLRIETNDELNYASTEGNIGSIYLELGDYAKAYKHLSNSLKVVEAANDIVYTSIILANLSDVFIKQKKYQKAIEHAKKSLEMSKKFDGILYMQYAANNLYVSYKALGNYKSALEMHELYLLLKDSVKSQENQNEIIRQELKYNYEKKAAADSVAFAKEKEIKEAQIAKQHAEIKAKRNQQIVLYGGLMVVFVFAGFMYNRFKVTQKQKAIIELAHLQLEEKNEEIIASIRYAKRIQDALLTSQKYIERNIKRLKKN